MDKARRDDDIINLYRSLVPMEEIANRFGISSATVHHTLKRHGVRALTLKERSELGALKSRCGITSEIASEIVSRYRSGESTNALSKRFGISRRAIDRQLRKSGIQTRTQSESAALTWEAIRTLDGGIARQCGAAWDGRRAGSDSVAVRTARAVAIQARGLKVFRHEAELAGALRQRGFPCTQQLAVGPYNLDIAVDGLPVAIEVIGAPPWEFRKIKLRQRTEYLLDLGWLVIFVRYHRRIRPVVIDHAAQQLVAYLDLARKDKTVFGQYGMVIGHPEYSPTSRYDLDGMPFVACPLGT